MDDPNASVDSVIRAANIDHYLDRLGMTDVDSSTRQGLLKGLIEEENKVEKTRRELVNAKRRVERGKARILALSQSIMQRRCGQQQLLRSLTSLATLYETQMLLEQHYHLLSQDLSEEDR
jgi:reverse gyrase